MFTIPKTTHKFTVHSGFLTVGSRLADDEVYPRTTQKQFRRYKRMIDKLIAQIRENLDFFTSLEILQWNVEVTVTGWGIFSIARIYITPKIDVN